MDDVDQTTRLEAKYLYELGLAAGQQRSDLSPFAIVPEGFSVESLEAYQARPSRIRQTTSHQTVESFLAYIRAFGTKNSRAFACREANSVTAILDYHWPEQVTIEDAPASNALGVTAPVSPAMWASHRCVLKLEPSPEWMLWIGNANKVMSQVQFGEFLEDNQKDIADPPGADVKEAALNLTDHRNVSFRSAKNLSTGAYSLQYIENESEAEMSMPKRFTIGIKVYKGGQLTAIEGRIRYVIKDQQVTFKYVLDRPDRIADEAFLQALLGISEGAPTLSIHQGAVS